MGSHIAVEGSHIAVGSHIAAVAILHVYWKVHQEGAVGWDMAVRDSRRLEEEPVDRSSHSQEQRLGTDPAAVYCSGEYGGGTSLSSMLDQEYNNRPIENYWTKDLKITPWCKNDDAPAYMVSKVQRFE